MFNSLFDQEQAVCQLRNYLHKACIPHALLFSGNDGLGKQDAARIFAMACNCTGNPDSMPPAAIFPEKEGRDAPFPENPCGQCRSCRKIQNGTHPDVLLIKPSNEAIKIAQIRSLTGTLVKKPHEARMRVMIIADAHYMNPEAANALLKALEEPPRHTVLILTARRTTDLLPTIVSRCQHIRFKPASRTRLRAALMEKCDLNATTAAVIAAMAGGSLSKALCMSEAGGWIDRRNWLLTEFSEILSPAAEARGKAGYTGGEIVSRLLALSEKLAADKTTLPEALEVLSTLIRDLIVVTYDPAGIINKDRRDTIRCASKGIGIESLLAKARAVEKAQKAVQSNAVIRLTLETMMLRLARA